VRDACDLTSKNGKLTLRRRLVMKRGESMGVAQDFETVGRHDATLVTAKYWFLSLVVVRRGTLHFSSGRGLHRVPDRFLFFMPAGAITRMPLDDARIETIGVAGSGDADSLPRRSLAAPCALEAHQALDERTLRALVRAHDEDEHAIDADIAVPVSVVRLRRELLARTFEPFPVGRVASDARLAASVLSRRFAACYGLSPREYCQRARVYAAAMSLFAGLGIARVGIEAGWTDLSRFYRQFRRFTSETPGRYRAAGLACDAKG
jgi:AraC-like DNA-binding protein